jgi:phosphoenolpyruvate-protein kinase (PTS system EI component)
MAGEPIYTALLIGLGAKSLSVSVSRLPEVKHYIRLMNLGELRELVKELLTLDQAEPIEQKLNAFLEKL